MEDALQRAQELISLYESELRSELPAGADIYDAHVHLGDDIDGMTGRFDELINGMERYGVSRANMFCLDEPDRHPGFRAANDRTLAFAERSEGRLVPFVRLDLTEEPIEEARRCREIAAAVLKRRFSLGVRAPLLELPTLVEADRPPRVFDRHRLFEDR